MHLHDNVIITLQNGRLRKFRLHARQLQVAVVSGVHYIQWLDGNGGGCTRHVAMVPADRQLHSLCRGVSIYGYDFRIKA